MKFRFEIWFLCFVWMTAAHASGKRQMLFDMAPLVGSTWLQENPGKLPFSKCVVYRSTERMSQILVTEDLREITLREESESVKGGVGLAFEFKIQNDNALLCWSIAHRLAYILPISIGVEVTFPAVGNATVNSHPYVIHSKSLHGKKVKDLLGGFYGAEMGCTTCCAGASISGTINSSGIRMTHASSFGEGWYLGCGPARISVKGNAVIPAVRYSSGEVENIRSYVIRSFTSAKSLENLEFVWDEKKVSVRVDTPCYPGVI